MSRLVRAIKHGNVNEVRNALAEGADPNAVCPKRLLSPLFAAAIKNEPECLQLLIEAKANVNERVEDEGYTALLVVPNLNGFMGLHNESGNERALECIKILLNAGCDMCAVDGYGNNVLHSAAAAKHADVLEYITSHDASKKLLVCKNDWGYTPLDCCTQGDEQSMCALLDAGARTTLRSWSRTIILEKNRYACKQAAATLYGILYKRKRIGRDMSGLIMQTLWKHHRYNDAWGEERPTKK